MGLTVKMTRGVEEEEVITSYLSFLRRNLGNEERYIHK